MVNSLKTTQFNSGLSQPLFNKTRSLSASATHTTALSPLSFGTRSRLEIGRFDRVFSSSGSVRRNFADVFRFELTQRRRLRIYLGNEFSGSSSNRRMNLDLIDDRTLRTVTGVRVNPSSVNVITRNLNPGVYRVQVSTQSNDRGRYFLDMIRV